MDEAVEVWGRVNSSKKSAKRGWCMCRYVEEESLLCCEVLVGSDLGEMRWFGSLVYHFED